MDEQRRRALAVVAILVAGAVFVFAGKGRPTPPRATGQVAAAQAPVPAAPVPAVKQGAPNSAVSETAPPWATKPKASGPVARYVKSHPTPLGKQIEEAIAGNKAVVLVAMPAEPKADGELRAFVTQCRKYNQSLARTIDIDLEDAKEQALLGELKLTGLQPPMLAGISLAGEVKDRLSGKLTKKQVIKLYADVTGSCGIECENGKCD